MTPRLILLTGPAAGEVADVLRGDSALFAQWGINCTKRALTGSDPFEVRDYLAAPLAISDDFCGARTVTPEGIAAAAHRAEGMAQAICSLPGGEAWLVGLVLPGTVPYTRLPARLAILAPEPPRLLVERVRDWGGDCWRCESYPDGWCYVYLEDGGSLRHMSWPEAVRAALGEEIVPSGAGGPASTPRFRPLDDGRWLEVREPEVAS